MLEIKEALSVDQLDAIEKLAERIWLAHYVKIIGIDQVEYMLSKFQSIDAMSQQINDGYEYFSVYFDTVLVGYFSFKRQEEQLFLSKWYVSEENRGKGIGKQCLNFMLDRARESALPAIQLTVNKYNEKAIAFYHKVGFKEVDQVVMDIGGGYVMDDYVFRLNCQY